MRVEIGATASNNNAVTRNPDGDTVAVDPFKQHLDVNDLRYSPGTTVNGSLNLLGLEDGFSSLPMEFRLKQNYPNLRILKQISILTFQLNQISTRNL